jgi:hypothetical protein
MGSEMVSLDSRQVQQGLPDLHVFATLGLPEEGSSLGHFLGVSWQ